MTTSDGATEGVPPKLARICGRKVCAKCGAEHVDGAFYIVGYGRSDSQMWMGDYVTTTVLAGTCSVFLCDDCVGSQLPSSTASASDLFGCLAVLAGIIIVTSVLTIFFAAPDLRPELAGGSAIISIVIGLVLLVMGVLLTRRKPQREPIKPRERVKLDPSGAKWRGDKLALKIVKPLVRYSGYNVAVSHDRYDSMVAEAERQRKRRDG